MTPVPTETVSASDIIARESAHVVQTYRRAPIVIARGRGVYLYDVDGREYLDLISGVGVASLGHANPDLARIVAEQSSELLHCSNLFFHPYQGVLAEKLATLSGLPRTFFCNSGTEAVEACLKFARRSWFTAGDRARTGIVALHGSFHGRTMGSLSVTADPHYRDPFGPLLGPCHLRDAERRGRHRRRDYSRDGGRGARADPG